MSRHIYSVLAVCLQGNSIIERHLANDWMVTAWICVWGSVSWLVGSGVLLAVTPAEEDRDVFNFASKYEIMFISNFK